MPSSPLPMHPTSAGSPNGLTRNVTTKNAIPPVGCPVINNPMDTRKVKPASRPNTLSDIASTNENKAAMMVNANANGTANSFKMSFIAITNPFGVSCILYIYTVILTLLKGDCNS